MPVGGTFVFGDLIIELETLVAIKSEAAKVY